MLAIGMVIDNTYQILSVIGDGGTSTVYLAKNIRTNRLWAIKEPKDNSLKQYNLDIKEIDIMKKLSHSHLAGISEILEKDGKYLIVMDYIEGESLNKVLKKGLLQEDDVIEYAKQLCEVLYYLHTQNRPIIYRDMKPENIMLKPDKKDVVLIDLGAAREYKSSNSSDTIALGTRGYAAPEQFAGGLTDARTDIYSLGVTIYCLVTGEDPHNIIYFEGTKSICSAGLKAIILKCTKQKKEERYQDCMELYYALEHSAKEDEEYRKKQIKNIIIFSIFQVLVLLFFSGAAIFKGMEIHTQKSNYDFYLLAAQNSTTKKDEIDNYWNAIKLNPSRGDAYLLLLQEGYLDDNLLTWEESEELRAILIDYGDKRQTNESNFQKNRKDYDKFAYQAGIAYFYKFEEKSNKKNAKGYFEIAKDSEYLEAKQVERALRLYTISDYYSKIGLADEAGDTTITYRTYWDDLTALSQGNLVEVDNERTALVMYKELVSQMISRTIEFKNAGVTAEEMYAQLENVKTHLRTDFRLIDDENGQLLESDIQVLNEDMEKAARLIHSANGQDIQEE